MSGGGRTPLLVDKSTSKGMAGAFPHRHTEIKPPIESPSPEQSSWKMRMWRLVVGGERRVERNPFLGPSKKNNLSASSFSCKNNDPICSLIFKEGLQLSSEQWQSWHIAITPMRICRSGTYGYSTCFMGLLRELPGAISPLQDEEECQGAYWSHLRGKSCG